MTETKRGMVNGEMMVCCRKIMRRQSRSQLGAYYETIRTGSPMTSDQSPFRVLVLKNSAELAGRANSDFG
jgi:hypothetical protein